MCLTYSAIKFVVKTHFKDAKEAVQQKVTLFFQVLFTKVKHTSRYGVTVHLLYDATGRRFFVVYLYVSGSGSITSVGEERANLYAVVYL